MDEISQTWVIVAFVLGLAAMAVELFLPGAILGTIGLFVALGSTYWAFHTGHNVTGGIFVGVLAVFFPAFFLLWRKLLGQVLSLKTDLKAARPSTIIDESLLGKEGDALSQLRPSGIALIVGKRYDVVTEGDLLDKGTRIKVIDVSGNRLVVKKV